MYSVYVGRLECKLLLDLLTSVLLQALDQEFVQGHRREIPLRVVERLCYWRSRHQPRSSRGSLITSMCLDGSEELVHFLPCAPKPELETPRSANPPKRAGEQRCHGGFAADASMALSVGQRELIGLYPCVRTRPISERGHACSASAQWPGSF